MKSKIKKILNYFPGPALNIIVNYFYKKNYNYTIGLLKSLSIDSKRVDFIHRHKILNYEESKKYIIKVIDPEAMEFMRTPDVYDLIYENFVHLKKREIAIYRFHNCTISPQSDLILLEDGYTFYEKLNRPEAAQIIAIDDNLIKVEGRYVYSLTKPNSINSNKAFNLCGVHTGAWAHFVMSYLPKLIVMKDNLPNEQVDLLVPMDALDNHKDLIKIFIENYNLSDVVNVKYVARNQQVRCKELIHCNSIGFIADHTKYFHPATTCISKFGAMAIREFMSPIWKTVVDDRSRKIYIGRGAKRNVYHSTDVENYFMCHGFEIVYPHLLSLNEKIQVFGNATHICGPVSSGFMNMIFCKRPIKILGLFNYSRSLDPFISGVIDHAGLDHSVLFITGIDVDENGNQVINNELYNSFDIPLSKISRICEEIDYFSPIENIKL